MSLGAGTYKAGGAAQCPSARKEISMAMLQAIPTRHPHTKPLSKILTDQYLQTYNVALT